MARRYYDLYPQITSFENLFLAYRKAAKSKRGQPAVAEFEFSLEPNLFDLQEQLQSSTYLPGGYYSFYIRDPKRRLVSAAPFRDRFVHHALCNVIEPLFERTFIGDSYANRIGKGTHAALDRAQGFARRYRYVLQCDVRQFFPSIDLQVLDNLLERKLGDPQALWLCRQIMESGKYVLRAEYTPVCFPGDDLLSLARRRGLPIGNLTSQFWANVYLNELDQFVKRSLRVPAYLRYVDDFLLFSDRKDQLWGWKKAIVQRLQALRLTLHEHSSTVYPVACGIPFLGFRIYPERRWLKRRNGVAFQRRLRRLLSSYAEGTIALAEIDTAVQGWVAHVMHGSTIGLRCSILSGAPIISKAIQA